MGTLRKLQTEIDKTLKKVNEGLEEFDETFDQLKTSDNVNQKEKHEANLKTELKKLQRYRDQIKIWLGGNEVKDKSDLLDARRDIERRMEAYKACERESKTKSYSREGLQAARLDPKERAKQDARGWLNNTVDDIKIQIEEIESEIEELSGRAKKKGKSSPRTSLLEDTVSRHQQHTIRLEQLLRLLDNDEISTEDVENIEELVDDYLERCQESPDEFTNPDDIYLDFLEEMNSLNDLALGQTQAKAGKDKEAQLEKEREEREREKQKAAAAAAKALLAAQGNLRLVNATEEEKKTQGSTPSKQSVAASSGPGALVPPPPPPPPPPVSGSRGPESPLAPGRLSAPGTPAFAAVASGAVSQHDGEHFPVLNTPSGPGALDRSPMHKAATENKQLQFDSTHSRIDDEALDGGLEQLASQMKSMKVQDSSVEMFPPQRLQILQMSAPRSIPLPSDSIWNLPTQRPKAPAVPPPQSYPAQKLPLFEAPVFFDKIEPETLFFAFHYQPATMQQLLAARSLKAKAWKFDREKRTWYQHASANANAAAIAQENGDPPSQFIHFDYGMKTDGSPSGWTYRFLRDDIASQ
eukprot:jgi/Picsp_1/611/NSC_00608-R1_ccr4-not transcription complex subunit 3